MCHVTLHSCSTCRRRRSRRWSMSTIMKANSRRRYVCMYVCTCSMCMRHACNTRMSVGTCIYVCMCKACACKCHANTCVCQWVHVCMYACARRACASVMPTHVYVSGYMYICMHVQGMRVRLSCQHMCMSVGTCMHACAHKSSLHLLAGERGRAHGVHQIP